MQNFSALVLSKDLDIIQLCQQLGSDLGLKVISKPDLATFLLELQEHDYQVALFDCLHMDDASLKWVKIVRKTRPKIPLIIFSDEVNRKMGGKIYDTGSFYLCERPVQNEVFRSVLNAAIKSVG